MNNEMITVIGSFVVDLMCRTPHMPVAGETVLGGPFKLGPGGKGANQAVAAARQGSEVHMVTKLGDDDFAELAKKNFAKENIDCSLTPIDPVESTGAALITVDDATGENMIVVATGACQTLTKEEVYRAEDLVKRSDAIVLQLETSKESVVAAVELATKYGVKVIFNPAPYTPFPEEIIPGITYATPNETEAGFWAGITVVDDDTAVEAARRIHAMGVKAIIITLGKRGCLVYEDDEHYKFVDSFNVKAVDTTGAGDAFNGGFAHAITNGMDLYEAVRYASAVAALSVTKVGTAPAMPYREEVEEFLKNN